MRPECGLGMVDLPGLKDFQKVLQAAADFFESAGDLEKARALRERFQEQERLVERLSKAGDQKSE